MQHLGYLFLFCMFMTCLILLLAPKRSNVDKLKSQLSSIFCLRDLGLVKKILDVEIFWDQKSEKL